MLCQAATADANFRAILQNAFVTCAIDGRRLPFLSAHLSFEESFDGDQSSDNGEDYQRTTASTQLMLFLELTTFMDLYSLTPETKRRDLAKRIAFKFFLPSKAGNTLVPPMFDFHHIVPDSDLRALEKALNDTEHPIGRDVFVPFQKSVMESLAGPPFLTFLLSDDCARMRGYLRNTAPFLSISPGDIFDGVVKDNSGTENNLQYLLMHLICQVEKEIGDEYDIVNGEHYERVIGAAGGVACAMYIKRRLSTVMNEAKKATEGDSSIDDGPFCDLVEAMELVWETFIAPGGGMLDGISNSNETEKCLDQVRELLSDAVKSSTSGREKLLESLTSAELAEAFACLSDHLLYDYAVNTYSKFKEHRFHEWMCNEVNITDGESETTRAESKVPELQAGCIRRLLRKTKLPPGVSPHKPIRTSQQSSSIETTTIDENEPATTPRDRGKESLSKIQNAEVAVVFGTDDGSGDNPVPNPAMDRTDLRRYVCQSVVLDNDTTSSSSFRVPQTLESYATVPLFRKIPFSDLTDDTRIRYALPSRSFVRCIFSFSYPLILSSTLALMAGRFLSSISWCQTLTVLQTAMTIMRSSAYP